ncbi:glycosyltransferase family A protein [Streptomyces sp. NPDC004610]|uniref:glycosyltransferase family 2 protein n=1 Tax=unclassified Streptomyces TaxID=2593676 RepID=UPI0033A42539
MSVVVPIYNAGSYIERCAPSLVEQSLGADAYEVVYVDDGSTDDSAERLGQLAEAHAHVRVFQQENSGWPGKPRNVGVDRARGEYIQFVDQDDELSYEALERMYTLGRRNGADIVLGKTHGTMQGPSNVFKRTVERCTPADAPLFESLTPHKMFRRDFLLAHGIRFPEGRVRLEDQLFMARAYVRAQTVSILGDYPCYRWNRREDGGNNSSRRVTADDYYGHLGKVVEAIKEGTEPGDLQDRMLRRSFRVELLRPVSEPRVLQRTGKDLDEYYTTVRQMAMTSYPPGVRAGLPAISGLRAELLVQGKLDSLIELARRTKQIKPQVELDDIRWRDGKLVIRTRIGMLRADGHPLTVVERDGRMLLDPELLDGIPGAEGWEVTDPFSHAYGELIVHDTGGNQWWYPDGELAPVLEPLGQGRHRVVVAGESVLDPLALTGGEPMTPGVHLVWAGGQLLGVGRRPRLDKGGARVSVGTVAVGTPPRFISPTWGGPGGQLRIAVSAPGRISTTRRLLLRTAADHRLRHGVREVLQRLPRGTSRTLRAAARRADRWMLR